MIDVNYPSILKLIENHLDKKRTESASFLIWYLENYYRIDGLEAIDSVCDNNGDKGVDGIYINEANGTIDIFQTKLVQNSSKSIGDTALKEFYGTLSQFSTKDTLKNLIDKGGKADTVNLIKRLGLLNILEQYKVRGIFIANTELDGNGESYLAMVNNIHFIGKNELESTFISADRQVTKGKTAQFDIVGLDISKHYADAETLAFIAPIKANELVKMPGISDQSVFAYNVRGALGGTNVNRDIVRSIKDKSLHKQFPLFHNGITIVTNKMEESDDKLTVDTFFVVNGCQSLTALYNNRNDLTDDLRILTKFVQVSVDSKLASTITHFSNNQNGVKARDFKSNNTIQIRLQNEVLKNYPNEYFFEIKRGENNNGLPIISNEMTGILLMSFDLMEPWGTHRKYQVFDEKYNQIYARPEVTAHRIVALHLIDQVVTSKLGSINNTLIAKYALTRYVIIYMIRCVLNNDDLGKKFLLRPEDFVHDKKYRGIFIDVIGSIINDIIIDFNGEVDSLGEDFDYKSRLRDEEWVKKISTEVVNSYLKLVNRGRMDSFKTDWDKKVNV